MNSEPVVDKSLQWDKYSLDTWREITTNRRRSRAPAPPLYTTTQIPTAEAHTYAANTSARARDAYVIIVCAPADWLICSMREETLITRGGARRRAPSENHKCRRHSSINLFRDFFSRRKTRYINPVPLMFYVNMRRADIDIYLYPRCRY